jgi:sugar-specific transcriptional regulator TrmB
MNDSTSQKSLMALGLTGLEARIYIHLLQESPTTGYRVAKALGKATANVYKALLTLEEKGAVEVDDGKTRLVRPVPVTALLGRLEHRFKRYRDEAADSLQRLPGPAHDTRIYQISDHDQVFGKCRQLLDNAQSVVLMDIFPLPLVELESDIEQAARRGLAVAAKTYAPFTIPGVETVLDLEHERILARWPAQWINVVADGAKLLLALLDHSGETVLQAVWSESPYLSWIQHSGLGSDLALSALQAELLQRGDRRLVNAVNERFARYVAPLAPGYRRLMNQLGFDRSLGESEFHKPATGANT